MKFKNKEVKIKFEGVYYDQYYDCCYDIFLENISSVVGNRTIVNVLEGAQGKPFMALDDTEVVFFNECI